MKIKKEEVFCLLISFLRSLILYLIVIFGLRIMGKRQLGQLQPSELVITILISNIATLPIENSDVPLILGIVPILTLMCFEVILSVCALKNLKLRRLIWGNTRVVIRGWEVRPTGACRPALFGGRFDGAAAHQRHL